MRQVRFAVLALTAVFAVPSFAQMPPQGLPDTQPAPQPVQPAPAPTQPVTPQPVQPPPVIPVEPQPVNPPPTLPNPDVVPPTPPTQQTGVADPNTTLAGKPGDVSDVDEVIIPAKPVIAIGGRATWDKGFDELSKAFGTLREEAARAKLPVTGRPLTLFTETTDDGFRFEAMLPVGSAPADTPAPSFGNGVRSTTTPPGPSLRFVHHAPYDDIDSTYETITAYLEAKSITVKDAFLEEYVSDLKDPGDPNLEINVYVQPR